MGNPQRRPFRLWSEVLIAYVAPALMAGVGGLVTGQPDLRLAACTSIAGTSAVVAALIGGWLVRGETRRRWTRWPPKVVLALGSGLVAAVAAGIIAWLVLGRLPAHDGPWPQRLQWDLPLSAALAATIVTWRWRRARLQLGKAIR